MKKQKVISIYSDQMDMINRELKNGWYIIFVTPECVSSSAMSKSDMHGRIVFVLQKYEGLEYKQDEDPNLYEWFKFVGRK